MDAENAPAEANPPRDQKVTDWFGTDLAADDAKSFGEVKTVSLSPSASTFVANAKQAVQLSNFPFQMAFFGQELKLAEIEASLKLFGKPRYSGGTAVFQGEFADEKRKQWSEESHQIGALVRDMMTGKVKRQLGVSRMVWMEDLVTFADDRIRDTYDTLMAAQLVLAWTAFETLAGDLWEAAVNDHPQTLASLKGIVVSQKDDEGKSLPMWHLEKYQYDIREKMGTILRKQRCQFTKLDDIVKAYRAAFPAGSAINSKVFWDNNDLKSAAAIRNLIVHRAGMIDKEFKNKTGHDQRLSHWSEREQFYLDGNLAQNLLRGLFGFGAKLIREVDDWIVGNPQ